MAEQETPELGLGQANVLVNIEDTKNTARYPDVYTLFTPNEIALAYQGEGNTFVYEANNGFALQVEVVNNYILRFRYAPEGHFPDKVSYALDPDRETSFPQVTMGGDDTHYFLQTEAINCRIAKADMRVDLYDRATQTLLCSDAQVPSVRRTIHRGVDRVDVYKTAAPEEAYFGLGDKSGPTNLRGQRLQNWNTDAFGYEAYSDPLYRTIPFYYSVHRGKSYGLYFNNTYRSHFDFAGGNPEAVHYWTGGGEIDYFYLHGPGPLDVARRYAWLTGRPELPPMWALGFHQCRWSYYPEARVRELADEFRERGIPCDAIYLDIDYMDGYRCFTWNDEHFPDPKGLISDLEGQGFQTVVMIDPGIRVDEDYHVYKTGMEQDVFCRRSTGELMRGPVWPPDCVFPDYTDPEVRAWWGPLYETLYNEQGVSGFWNDMNEPAVFKVNTATFPDHVLHDYDGHPRDHRGTHNIYGLQMSRATYEGLKALQPEKRPFLLTRATFSGGQRFASVWTGDNLATWEHLRIANVQCQRLSISGFSFVGTDIGGFSGNPDGELFVRWLQLGAFHPFYRVHSMGNNVDGAAEAEADAVKEAERLNRADQEPWSYGEPYTSLARRAIEFRYQLLPYLYTAFWENTRSGTPILRSLFLYSPEDTTAVEREEEFLFGEHLLVMPVLKAGVQSITGYLPKGDWLDYWSGVPYQGQQMVTVKAAEDRMPVFVKAGAVIPNYPVQQYVGEQTFEAIDLRVYPGSAISYLYEDAGEGYGYTGEDYALRQFTTDYDGSTLRLNRRQEGQYAVSYVHFNLHFIGLARPPRQVLVDGEAMAYAEADGQYGVQVPAGFKEVVVEL